MSTVFFTPSQSKQLYEKKRKTSILSIPLLQNDIASNTQSYFRWIVLIIICWSMFSYSYCYDNPVALQNQLMSKYNLSNIQYNLLYSAYTFPNMILPFFSGILSDIFNADLMIIIFFIFIVIGQLIFIIGNIISKYYLMFIGRFIFGIGAESFSLVITPLIYEYFKNKELSFSLGLLLSLSRLGSSTNDYLTFYIYTKTNNNIIIPLFTGLILLIFALILIILLLLQRYSVYFVLKKNKNHSLLQKGGKRKKIIEKKNIYYDSLTQHSINSTDIEHLKYESMDEKSDDDDIIDDNNNNNNNKLKLSDINKFDQVFWLLVINCGLIYGVVLSFMNIGSDYLQTHYGYNHKLGNTLLMLPYIVSAIITPIFGYISDKIGKRCYLLLISTIMLIITHFIFIFISTAIMYFSIIAMICLGISYSIFCAVIWPSFALVVPDKLIGTGYGIPCVFYNCILSIFYILVGILTNTGNKNKSNKNYYQNVEIFLFSLSIFSTLTVILLIIIDKRNGSRLNIPIKTC